MPLEVPDFCAVVVSPNLARIVSQELEISNGRVKSVKGNLEGDYVGLPSGASSFSQVPDFCAGVVSANGARFLPQVPECLHVRVKTLEGHVQGGCAGIGLPSGASSSSQVPDFCTGVVSVNGARLLSQGHLQGDCAASLPPQGSSMQVSSASHEHLKTLESHVHGQLDAAFDVPKSLRGGLEAMAFASCGGEGDGGSRQALTHPPNSRAETRKVRRMLL
jgi:hypothetical protein